MKTRNISNNIRMKIRRYIEYMHEEEKLGVHRGDYLLKSLSNNLKDELLFDSYNKIISKIKILNKNFSEKFLDSLTLSVQEITFAPEEIIFKVIFIICNKLKYLFILKFEKKGDEERGFFYIISGEVEYFLNNNNSKNQSNNHNFKVYQVLIFFIKFSIIINFFI